MNISRTKKIITKSGRAIIKEVTGSSDGFISDVLNEKANNKTVSAKIVIKVAKEVASDFQKTTERLKTKYSLN